MTGIGWVGIVGLALGAGPVTAPSTQPEAPALTVSTVLERVRQHGFEPNNTPRGTSRGVGDLNDQAWRVRTLAIRDLVRLGRQDAQPLAAAVEDGNRHVRHVGVTALGILGAKSAASALRTSRARRRSCSSGSSPIGAPSANASFII